jgi:hypothetical protein
LPQGTDEPFHPVRRCSPHLAATLRLKLMHKKLV